MSTSRSGVDIILIASSTGGPEALKSVLAGLPGDLNIPIAVVQHLPSGFTGSLAATLNDACELTVTEAANGQPLEGGTVLIAPGGKHLDLVPRSETIVAHVGDAPAEDGCKPSASRMFRSAAKSYGAAALAIVLTGMGEDGRDGCSALHEAGAAIMIQDPTTAVAPGMPTATLELGIAKSVRLEDIPAAILRRVLSGATR